MASRDVIGHVTIGFTMCHFLLVVINNIMTLTFWAMSRGHWTPCNMLFPVLIQFEPVRHTQTTHGFWDIEIQRYLLHDLDLLGSHEVIGHMTTGVATYGLL